MENAKFFKRQKIIKRRLGRMYFQAAALQCCKTGSGRQYDDSVPVVILSRGALCCSVFFADHETICRSAYAADNVHQVGDIISYKKDGVELLSQI